MFPSIAPTLRRAATLTVLIAAALGFVIVPPVPASAVSAEETDGAFTFTWEGTDATITGYDTGIGGATAVIPSTVTSTDGPKTVTTIGVMAFFDKGLTAVTLPPTLVTIGFGAFWSNSLTSLAVPAGVTTIDDFAFMANSLTTLTLPDAIISLGSSSFAQNDLTAAVFPPLITELSTGVYRENQITAVTIPAHITTVGNAALAYNPLAAIDLPTTVTSWGEGVFSFTRLTSVVIPEEWTTIPAGMFEGCIFLTDVNWPAGLVSVGDHAFEETKVSSLILPEGFTTIGEYAFSSASLLHDVQFPSTLRTIKRHAFFASRGVQSVTLPDGLTTIGMGAFQFTGLTSIDIPGSVTTVSRAAFMSNVDLTSITLHEGTQVIGDSAFMDNAITDLVVPASVTSIGGLAFSSNEVSGFASSLDTVLFEGAAPTMGSYVFTTDPLITYRWAYRDGYGTPIWNATADDSYRTQELATVAFDAAGGTLGESATLDALVGTSISAPTPPTRTGYTFGGWTLGADEPAWNFASSTVAGDMTLVASWTPIDYDVTLDPNNGDASTTVSIPFDDLVPTPDDPTRDGYTFGGWTLGADGPAWNFASSTVAGDMTLVASWTPIDYDVTLDPNNGDASTTVSHPFDDLVPTPDDPTRDGYTLGGWSPDGSAAWDFATGTVSGPLTLTAQWEANMPSTSGDSQTRAGAKFVVTGSGFTPGERVRIELHSTPVLLATVVADAAGHVAATVTIPSNTTPGAHQIILVGEFSGEAFIDVTVGEMLAATGTALDETVALSLMLILVGTSLVATRRRFAATR